MSAAGRLEQALLEQALEPPALLCEVGTQWSTISMVLHTNSMVLHM